MPQHFTEMPGWLATRARDRRDHPALVASGETVTYGELGSRVSAAAAALVGLGIGTGDRVALLLPTDVPFVILLHALAHTGAVAVPLHPRLTAGELSFQIADCGARYLVCAKDDARAGELRRLLSETSLLAAEDLCRSVDNAPALESRRVDLGAEHTILYTSGSSGRPKGVRLSAGNHWWSAVASALHLGVRADDRWLAALPAAHIGGLAILLRSVLYGTTAVLRPRFDPEDVSHAIDHERVTLVSVVPAMLQRMLDARGDRPYPDRLRCVLLGGAAASADLIERCAVLRVPVAPTYGLTETSSQVATLAPSAGGRPSGSAGKALFPTELRCASDGEILVRGPTVSAGYVGHRTPLTDEHGWLHTGDVGRTDDDGFLYVLGRRDAMIVSGGENVHPAEVEAVLGRHPAVAECCVLGVPDREWGEAVVAYVRPAAGTQVDEEELRRHVRAFLAGFKTPRRIFWIDQ